MEKQIQQLTLPHLGPKPEKVVQGLTLKWSAPDNKWMLPAPENAPVRFLYDEQENKFVQVANTQPDYLSRTRTVTQPDGSSIQEQLVIGYNESAERARLLQKKMKLESAVLETANGMVYVIYAGLLVSAAVFFWNLAASMGLIISAFAVGTSAAISEAGYLIGWIVMVVIILFAGKYILPILLKRDSGSSQNDSYSGQQESVQAAPKAETHIHVNTFQGGTGTAQDYINNR